jgi:glutaconate CoA-transferase subunit A
MAWDEIARERQAFMSWMEEHVLGTSDHAAHLRALKVSA